MVYFKACNYMNLVLSIIIYILSVINRLPISLYVAQIQDVYVNQGKRKKFMKQTAGYQESFKMETVFDYLENYVEKKVRKYVHVKIRNCIKVLVDRENLYNLCFVVSLELGRTYHQFYGALLVVDLFNNSPSLSNILAGLKQNFLIFAKTILCCFICIYLFAIVGFYYLSEYFISQEYSKIYGNKLLLTLASTLNFGMRKGGGIGEVLVQPIKSVGENYYLMILYQMLFYLLIN